MLLPAFWVRDEPRLHNLDEVLPVVRLEQERLETCMISSLPGEGPGPSS